MKTATALCLLVLVSAAVADTTYVEIGTPDRLNAVPFWGQAYDAFRLQWLYYAPEIGRSGRIVSVGIFGAPDAPAWFARVRLLLCHTNVSQLAASFSANYAGNTPTEVFSAETLVVGDGPPADWFTFPADFDYDNAKNLIVEICWRGDEGRNVNFYRRNVTHDYRRLFAYDDTAQTGFADTVPGNNIRFGFVTTSLAEPVQYVEPRSAQTSATIVRGVLSLGVDSRQHTAYRAALLDAAGRAVMVLQPGANDVSHLAPGIYFVRQKYGVQRQASSVTRVIIAR